MSFLIFFSKKLFTEVFVKSEPEVLTLKVLLQIFESDCSLHFSKNSLGSQKYLSMRRSARYKIVRAVSSEFLGRRKKKVRT